MLKFLNYKLMKKSLRGYLRFIVLFLIISSMFLAGCPRRGREVSSLEARLSKYKNAPPDALYQLARVAAASKKYDTAEYFLNLVIQKNPRFDPAYAALGIIYLKLNETDKAEMFFQKALQLNPNNEYALMNLGVIRIKQKRYLEGRELLEKATRVAPDYIDAWFNLGHLYDKMGDYDLAIRAFQKLVELEPEIAGFHYQLGMLYLKREMFDEALHAFLDAQKYAPERYEPYYQAAIIYHMKKRIYQAVKNYKKAITYKPTHFESYLNLADIYLFELNDKEEAKFFYERARSLRPSDSYVNKRLREITAGKYDYMVKRDIKEFMTEEDKREIAAKTKKQDDREEKFKKGQVLYIKKVDASSADKKESKIEIPQNLPSSPIKGKYMQFSNPDELRQLLLQEGISN